MNQDSGGRNKIPAFGMLQLAAKYQNLLVYGDIENRYGGDGSRVVGAIIVHAVRQGASPEWLFGVLCNPQNRGGFASMKRRRSDIRRWFERDWERAVRLVNRSPVDASDVRFRVQELREYANRVPWRGVAGASDHSVFDALLRIASRIGRLGDFDASAREVAELAEVSKETAARSLKRLAKRGLVRQERAACGANAAKWSLRLDWPERAQLTQTYPHQPLDVEPVCVTHARGDIFRWGTLGKSAGLVWSRLSNEPLSARQLASELGTLPGTVRRHLGVLFEHDLAVRDDFGHWFLGPESPEAVAEKLGVAGTAEHERQRHREERARFFTARQAHAIALDTPPERIDYETGEVIATNELHSLQVVELAGKRIAPRHLVAAAMSFSSASPYTARALVN